MASLNKVSLIGALGADPQTKSFQNGGQVCNLRLATSESWKDKQSGERKERTEWHSVTINSDALIGIAEKYLRKGSKLYVEGKLQTRKWQDQSGNDRYSTEIIVGGFDGKIIMLDGKKPDDGQERQRGGGGAQSGGFGDDLDDDVPFATASFIASLRCS